MRFWAFVSYFRCEQHILEEILSEPKWRQYAEWVSRLSSLVQAQERVILDSEVRVELCTAALSSSRRRYRLQNNYLKEIVGGPGTDGLVLSPPSMYITATVATASRKSKSMAVGACKYGASAKANQNRSSSGSDIMYYICKCTQNCGNGYVGFWRCGDGKTLILRCDEGEAPWLRPDDVTASQPLAVEPPAYLLPGSGVAGYGPNAGWASEAEISSAGWQGYIAGKGNGLDEAWKARKGKQ